MSVDKHWAGAIQFEWAGYYYCVLYNNSDIKDAKEITKNGIKSIVKIIKKRLNTMHNIYHNEIEERDCDKHGMDIWTGRIENPEPAIKNLFYLHALGETNSNYDVYVSCSDWKFEGVKLY